MRECGEASPYLSNKPKCAGKSQHVAQRVRRATWHLLPQDEEVDGRAKQFPDWRVKGQNRSKHGRGKRRPNTRIRMKWPLQRQGLTVGTFNCSLSKAKTSPRQLQDSSKTTPSFNALVGQSTMFFGASQRMQDEQSLESIQELPAKWTR